MTYENQEKVELDVRDIQVNEETDKSSSDELIEQEFSLEEEGSDESTAEDSDSQEPQDIEKNKLESGDSNDQDLSESQFGDFTDGDSESEGLDEENFQLWLLDVDYQSDFKVTTSETVMTKSVVEIEVMN